jgi:hypothetical protein
MDDVQLIDANTMTSVLRFALRCASCYEAWHACYAPPQTLSPTNVRQSPLLLQHLRHVQKEASLPAMLPPDTFTY